MCKSSCDPFARWNHTRFELECGPDSKGVWKWWLTLRWEGHTLYQGGYDSYDQALAQLQPDALAALMVEHVNAEEAAELLAEVSAPLRYGDEPPPESEARA